MEIQLLMGKSGTYREAEGMQRERGYEDINKAWEGLEKWDTSAQKMWDMQKMCREDHCGCAEALLSEGWLANFTSIVWLLSFFRKCLMHAFRLSTKSPTVALCATKVTNCGVKEHGWVNKNKKYNYFLFLWKRNSV